MKIVIKVGTQAILSDKSYVLEDTLQSLVDQIVSLQQEGHHVVLVSSGAVATGRRIARDFLSREYGHSLAEKQVLASIGQPELIHTYANYFQQKGVLAAQLLLTKHDFKTRQHYLNIARILREILSRSNIIPIVNENDTVAVEKLMFTDNDELAGLIAAQIDADKLIILTSVAGVYDGLPSDPSAKVIPIINPKNQWQKVASVTSTHGRGGMLSKLSTARKMSELGIMTHIAHVNEPYVLLRLAKNELLGTQVLPFKKKTNIKRWLVVNDNKSPAQIFVNTCLFHLLKDHSKVLSILPIGIEKIHGEFQKGDLVNIISPSGKKIGIGQAKYGSDKLKEYIGQNGKPVFIHYDHLVIEQGKLHNEHN